MEIYPSKKFFQAFFQIFTKIIKNEELGGQAAKSPAGA